MYMKLHRFIGNFNLAEKTAHVTERDFVNQIRNVLHLNVGEELILSSGNGEDVLAKIESYGDKYVDIAIMKRIKNSAESGKKVTLYLSVLKRENFELAAQKATETGIARIVPVISARTVKMNINNERVEKIVKEAAEQSGRSVVPSVALPKTFDEAIEETKKNDITIFFDAEGKEFNVTALNRAKSVGIFIGPEGGWTKEEIKIAKDAKYTLLNLGTRTLRAETAATIASYLACQ